MKKWIITTVVIIIFAFLFFNFFVSTDGGCDPPERPKNVPKEAIWKGGCDGGNWIQLIDIKDKVCRFRIFRDWNGNLILDADFEYKNCNGFYLTENNWTEYVAYFGNSLEFFNKPEINESCRMDPVYPVYYEESID